MQTYGLPLCYYVDSLCVFRFVQHRDGVWKRQVLGTYEADPQWHHLMRLLGVEVKYALPPQAKDKVERPFRRLQDHIVRTCALENVSSLKEVRAVLREDVHAHSHPRVHSTTHEAPAIRFDQAIERGLTLFRCFVLPRPYTSLDDVFCLRETPSQRLPSDRPASPQHPRAQGPASRPGGNPRRPRPGSRGAACWALM